MKGLITALLCAMMAGATNISQDREHPLRGYSLIFVGKPITSTAKPLPDQKPSGPDFGWYVADMNISQVLMGHPRGSILRIKWVSYHHGNREFVNESIWHVTEKTASFQASRFRLIDFKESRLTSETAPSKRT